MASNHLSYLDPAAVGVACPRRVKYMARHDLFKPGFASWWLTRVGCIPIKRNSADISAMKDAINFLESGWGLLLFPEGRRRNPSEGLGEPNAGIGLIAEKSGVPVVPVFIKGSDEALGRDSKMLRLAKISVTFGKQIRIERGMPYQDAAQLIMAGIKNLSC